jgi:hypothetical protein
MNHTEAVEQMAAERYLLDELNPDIRGAFEEHFFDCPECAVDLRAGAVFVAETKIQLPKIMESFTTLTKVAKPREKQQSFWVSLWRPAFAAPAFATLLLVLLYQNTVTLPALREASSQPRVVRVAPLRGATRGGEHIAIAADRAHGVALPVDLFTGPGMPPAASYAFDLRDPQGKEAWTATIAAPASTDDQSFSVVIPGATLRNGSYTLSVTSVGAQGTRTPLERYVFDIVVAN